MNEAKPLKATIRPVGSLGEATLEIRGTVLVYHQSGWAGSATVFIPVEWISISETMRRDNRRLVRAVFFFLIVAVLFGVMDAALHVLSGDVLPWVLTALGAPAAFFVFVGAFWLATWGRRRPAMLLWVNSEPAPQHIEFWRARKHDEDLETLMERLKELSSRIRDYTSFPLQTSHTWYRLRPLRALVIKGLMISVLLYAPVALLSEYINQPALMLFLLAPPGVYLARYLFEEVRSLSEPRAFRAAVRSYNRGEAARASALLRTVIAEHPRHIEALMLSAYADIELNDFPRAFELCRALAAADSELADEFVKEVWALKRMHDRMQIDV
nr:hypothetical protein [Candidatus Hydrogenedentota bacterium]